MNANVDIGGGVELLSADIQFAPQVDVDDSQRPLCHHEALARTKKGCCSSEYVLILSPCHFELLTSLRLTLLPETDRQPGYHGVLCTRGQRKKGVQNQTHCRSFVSYYI